MANRASILNKSLVMWQVDPSYLSVPMHAQLLKKRMKSISINNIIFGSRSDILCIYRSEVGVRIRWDELQQLSLRLCERTAELVLGNDWLAQL